MTTRRERVVLELNDNFTGRMAAAAEAGREISRLMALRAATWEPHDWSDWEA